MINTTNNLFLLLSKPLFSGNFIFLLYFFVNLSESSSCFSFRNSLNFSFKNPVFHRKHICDAKVSHGWCHFSYMSCIWPTLAFFTTFQQFIMSQRILCLSICCFKQSNNTPMEHVSMFSAFCYYLFFKLTFTSLNWEPLLSWKILPWFFIVTGWISRVRQH